MSTFSGEDQRNHKGRGAYIALYVPGRALRTWCGCGFGTGDSPPRHRGHREKPAEGYFSCVIIIETRRGDRRAVSTRPIMSLENHAARRAIGGRPDWSPLHAPCFSHDLLCFTEGTEGSMIWASRRLAARCSRCSRWLKYLCALCASVVNRFGRYRWRLGRLLADWRAFCLGF